MSLTFINEFITVLLLSQIPLFQQNPHLKQFVRPSIERAVQELVHPVVERSIKICLTTAEMIVKKVRHYSLSPTRWLWDVAMGNMMQDVAKVNVTLHYIERVLNFFSFNLGLCFGS